MTKSLDALLQTRLDAQREQHLYRFFQARQGAYTASVEYQDKNYLAFTNNDYLGLSHHPSIIKAVQQATDIYGVGSTASHTLGGHCQVHEELEQALAQFTGRRAALVFSTGYMANLAVISTLVTKQDSVFADRLVHASIIDGIHLSDARMVRYHHNDIDHLILKLARYTEGNRLIVSEGVFSMDGDLGLLPELVHTAREQNAWLMIDDAHGIGVLGKQGAGSCEHFALTEHEVPILIGTLSKALGCFGGFVAGSKVLIESLQQFARPYMFTTAMPPLLAQAALASLDIIQTETWRREYLHELITYFRARATEINLPLLPSTTPIQPILIGDNQKVMQLQNALRAQGILVAAIRPPTVPMNTARLRISLNVMHTREDVDKLIDGLRALRP